MAMALRSVASNDGNVLLFNAHISSRADRPILYPTDDRTLPDDFARMLFRMSSPLPPEMLRQAKTLDSSVIDGAAGFAFNADLATVIMFLNVGTRVSNI